MVTTFNYTPRQRVGTITVGGAPPANYAYDYTGQRIRYRGQGLEKRYLYDGLTLIGQTNVIGNTIARYHYGDRYQLAETREELTNSYFHVDSLGTNVAVTTVDGNLVARYEYDAYGKTLSESGTSLQPFGFTGYQKDEETDLYYANARYYDSTTGRFLTEDPVAGDQELPMSLHRYIYAYVNPNRFFDPDGKTAAQFEELMATAVEKFTTSGNRTALGNTGELVLEKILKANGEVIIKGPVTQPGAHNADIISFDPEKNQLTFFDNKIQSLKANVSRVPNLSKDSGKQKSIEEAQKMLKNLDLDPKMEKKIVDALETAAKNPMNAIWAVANANAEELTGVNNKVKRVSQRLVDKGVLFADVVDNKINILSKLKSSTNGKKISKKLLSTLPALGTILLTVSTIERVEAADNEDKLFVQAMSELGINDPLFPHQSVAREVAIITAEEAAGTGGFTAGAAAAAGPSAACGFGYPACVLLGGVIGGLVGDTAGGASAGFIFDKANQPTTLQMQIIREKVREERRNADMKIISEDSQRAGGH